MPEPVLDPRLVMTGKDGRLYSEDGEFLAEVTQWQAQYSVTNADYQSAGSALVFAVMTGYSVTLTFTETVVRDTKLLTILATALAEGRQPVFGFQGKLQRPDGSMGWYVFQQCVPDGQIDIANVQSGDVLTRAWSFRCNKPPAIQQVLGG